MAGSHSSKHVHQIIGEDEVETLHLYPIPLTYTPTIGTMPDIHPSFESDARAQDLWCPYDMKFAAFPPSMVLQSHREDINYGTTLPAWRPDQALADESVREPTELQTLYFERLYLFMPIFDVADVQQRLLVCVPKNLSARRYAFLSAIRAAAHTYTRFASDNRDEDCQVMLDDAIKGRRQYDIIDQEDHYGLEGLLGSFFLFIACWNQDRETHAWWYLRECIGLALSRRMNQEAAYKKLNEHEAEYKRRIFWTLFVTERTFCLMHNKPVILQPHITLPRGPDHCNWQGVMDGSVWLVALFQCLVFDSSGCWTAAGFMTPITLRGDSDGRFMSQNGQPWNNIPTMQRLECLITREWLQAKVWKLGSVHPRSSSEFVASSANTPWQLDQPLLIGGNALEILQSSVDVLVSVWNVVLDRKLYDICVSVCDVQLIMQTVRPGESDRILRGFLDVLCKVGGRTADFLSTTLSD